MTTESESAKSAKRELTEQEVQEERDLLKELTEEEEQEYQEILKELKKQKELRPDKPADKEDASDKEAQAVISSEDGKCLYSIDDINHYIFEKINKLSLIHANKLYVLILILIYTFAMSEGLSVDNPTHPCSPADGCWDGFFLILIGYPLIIISIIVANVKCYHKSKSIVNNWIEKFERILSSKTKYSDIFDLMPGKQMECRIYILLFSNQIFKIVLLNIFSLFISFMLSILIAPIQIGLNKFIRFRRAFYYSLDICIFSTLFVLFCLIISLIIYLIKVRYYRKKYQRSQLND